MVPAKHNSFPQAMASRVAGMVMSSAKNAIGD
jgi:hypothetical protein